ncbi:MAG: PAS domain S-box protein [Gemmatimonadetes bacterium]|nr:PAS domain S-box protein [Gemmatimonadota bacterium]
MSRKSKIEPDREVEAEAQSIVEDAQEAEGADEYDGPLIVAVGASAGGLSPLEEFFEEVRPGAGISYVVVQHLSPDFKSVMVELLSRHTDLSVLRVEDGTAVAEDTIYLIPPGKNMTLKGGRLRLFDQIRTARQVPNFPIDGFFESLAHSAGDRAVAVVLSGSGTDGTRGAEAIHAAGGLVLVQDPQTAQFDGMPLSVINTGCADRVATPDGLAREVWRFARGRARSPESAGVRDGLQRVVAALREEGELDFAQYRPTTLFRRIDRRMVVMGVQEFDDYAALLRESAQERQTLRRDLLISVSAFFRDGKVWEIVRNDVIGPLVERSSVRDEIRLWVSACATGEEVYTVGILLLEEMERRNKRLRAKMFASDVDAVALQRASAGQFLESTLVDVSPDRVQRFFRRSHDGYVVSRELREMVIFSQHDLTRDAPFTRMDLVTCRNALIYMQPQLQLDVLESLHFALRPGGALVLGVGEALTELEGDFEPVDRRWRVFRKREAASHRGARAARHRRTTRKPSVAATSRGGGGTDMVSSAFAALSVARGNLCLLVDESGSVMHVIGDASPYLSLSSGPLSTGVAQLLRREVATPVSTAIHRALRDGEEVRYRHVRFTRDDVEYSVGVRAVPVAGTSGVSDFAVVELSEEAALGSDGAAADLEHDVDLQIADLARELQETRESLQTTVEELATTTEEHQATNEELLASNEELHSTNEELQSVNEELYSVNAEYQKKIQELTVVNNDMDNLLRSTEIGTVFLDRSLRIRRFTPAAARAIHLESQDIGRPILHLSHELDVPDLKAELEAFLETGEAREMETRTRGGDRDYYLRILPYRMERQRDDGLVITLVDTTEIKRRDRALAARDAQLQIALDAGRIGTWRWEAGDHAVEVTGRVGELLGLGDPGDRVSLTDVDNRLHPDDRPADGGFVSDLLKREGEDYERTLRVLTESGSSRLVYDRGRIFRDAAGSVVALTGALADVSEVVEAEERMSGAFDAAPAGILLVDEHGKITHANAWVVKAFGYSHEELVGRSVDMLVPERLRAPHGDMRAGYVAAPRARPMNSGLDLMARRKDGSELAVQIGLAPLETASGRRIIAGISDVSELRQREQALRTANQELERSREHYRRLFDLAAVSMWEIDFEALRGRLPKVGEEEQLEAVLREDPAKVRELTRTLEVRAVNAATREILQVPGDWEPNRLLELILREEAHETAIGMLLALARGEEYFESEATVSFPGSRTVDIFYRIHFPPVGADASSVPVSVLDVSGLKRAERELRRALVDLERTNSELEQFAYVASHDLQEPLRKLVSFSQLLETDLGDDVPPRARRDLEFIVAAASRMRSLIRALLDFARAGRAEIEMHPVNLNPCVDRVLDALALRVEETGARIEREKIPMVLGDEALLTQVLQNLVANGLKFVRPGESPHLRIYARQDGGFVSVAVEDHGIGVPAEHRDAIFEPFRRLHGRAEYEGTGIGLAICRKIAEKHGGGVWIEETEGGGASFFVSVPAAPGSSA